MGKIIRNNGLNFQRINWRKLRLLEKRYTNTYVTINGARGIIISLSSRFKRRRNNVNKFDSKHTESRGVMRSMSSSRFKRKRNLQKKKEEKKDT